MAGSIPEMVIIHDTEKRQGALVDPPHKVNCSSGVVDSCIETSLHFTFFFEIFLKKKKNTALA